MHDAGCKQFEQYLELCDPHYRHSITAYSPEIRKDMTWLEHDKVGTRTLFVNLPRHNSDQSPITRHVTLYTIEHDDSARSAKVVSALQGFRTHLDGGATELFAAGKPHDTINLAGGKPRLSARNVRLGTRMLGYGYHISF